MPFIDFRFKHCALAVGALLTACSSPMPSPAPVEVARPTTPSATTRSAAPSMTNPSPVRGMNELRLQAARRLVETNPGGTYTGRVPDMLLAIPVLEVELNSDGSIRRIEVLRRPSQAQDTVQLAIDAMRRAGPFGDVSRAPKPWKFTESFLFNDERKFKPRTLDE